jgi:hypothetical protein
MRAGKVPKWIETVALKHEGDDCLAWPFSCTPPKSPLPRAAGRPQMRHNGKVVTAIRVILEMAKGPPPSPKHVAAHSCGKGHLRCVSPLHLDWKTRKEDREDMIRHRTAEHCRGHRHGQAKLIVDQVRSIRMRHAAGETAAALGREFGVTSSCIAEIVHRIGWKHVA